MKKYNHKEKFDREKSPHRDGNRESFKPSLFKATCNHCGKECEVPFKPNGSKPVYCSTCFNKDQHEAPRKSSRGSEDRNFTGRGHRDHGFSDRSMDRPERFTAVCETCGEDCEVPFRPRTGKPVYCDNCFEKPDRSKDSGAEGFRKELEALHHKLDKILAVLDAVVEKLNPIPPETVEEVPAPVKKTRKTAEKEPAVKKPLKAKKKAVPQPSEEEDESE